MVSHHFLPSHVQYSIITVFFLLICPPSSYCEEDQDYSECKKPFNCGLLSNLSYPFWRDGHSETCDYKGLKLQCDEEEKYPVIIIAGQRFRVLSVNRSINEISIARSDFWDGNCPQNFKNTTFDPNIFSYFPARFPSMSLFYNCSNLNLYDVIPSLHTFQCSVTGGGQDAFYTFDWFPRKWSQLGVEICNIRVDVPVSRMVAEQRRPITELLKLGFNVSFNYTQECIICNDSGGICGTNLTTGRFACLCPDQPPHPVQCLNHPDNSPNIKLKVGIGLAASIGSIIIMSVLFFIYLRHRKKNSYAPSSFVSQSNTSDFSSKSDIERGVKYGVQLFTYQQLEEATNNFDPKNELGEGGFGTVYYGKLQDKRLVAVKRLYENNYKRVEQFLNEVDILTHLRHPHLVALYGCTSRHSRELLLVYEYIPNGTIADHLHGGMAKPGALPWHTRMSIAVETATALAYLHAKDIIHRDIKTNNILLDHNFCVKVADFGLSRLFPLDVTHVSTAPQGTPGYVDPEYHECYQLTDKSDVYSFGVVLIELISSMPAVDITRHRHEINLSNMAINKIQTNALHELVDQSLGFNTDYAVRKMITAVAELAFQCLQSAKELRPSMDEVLETLSEIKNKEHNLEKEEQMDIQSDDVGLLKSSAIPPSPGTVMITWTSNSTTPNTSA